MLIHVDRIEDWTPPSPRSSHSGQSGLPSSDSDNDDHPFPAVTLASWTMGVEDGQRGARPQRRAHASVANLGCSGMPQGGRGQDNNGDGGSRATGQRSWKDVLLWRSRTPARKTQPGASRQRSRLPRRPKSTSRRQGEERQPRHLPHHPLNDIGAAAAAPLRHPWQNPFQRRLTGTAAPR
ncbi:hypothetical protein D1007_33763 [Hordeum vulgare]|nr:hypothetical protein D1007_33763 [Hordeum vulgare]